jgi:hypothetical protein
MGMKWDNRDVHIIIDADMWGVSEGQFEYYLYHPATDTTKSGYGPVIGPKNSISGMFITTAIEAIKQLKKPCNICVYMRHEEIDSMYCGSELHDFLLSCFPASLPSALHAACQNHLSLRMEQQNYDLVDIPPATVLPFRPAV